MHTDKRGDEIVSSFRHLLVAHEAGGFDSWVVLNSSVEKILKIKFIKIGRGLISLSFRCGVKIGNRVEVPHYVIIKCIKSHIKSSLAKIGREYGPQPETFK